MTGPARLEVEDLRIEVAGLGVHIADDISFTIAAGEILGLVGESGSGKTTVGLALLGHARRGVRIAGGAVRIEGNNILERSAAELQALRGRTVSYVPQDPAAALNPALRIDTQLIEVLRAHRFGASDDERWQRIDEMLEEVALPRDRSFIKRFPHQLSGGQQQRIGLAIAFACRPSVLVLDEPTTGLDVTTQAHILDTVRDLCTRHSVAGLYVSHDLAVVADISTRVAVLYAGTLVELGPQRELFTSAAHPYTRRLVQAIPDISGSYALSGIQGRAPSPGRRPAGCVFSPRCEFVENRCQTAPPATALGNGHFVRCWRSGEVRALTFGATPSDPVPAGTADSENLLSVRGVDASYGQFPVLHDISFDLLSHECLALVGESGSGKTTLARCISGIHDEYRGEIRLAGAELPRRARDRSRETRKTIQYIFQSPYSSLNPRKSVGQILEQRVRLFFDLGRAGTRQRVVTALERVSLSGDYIARYPYQMSGGERQRVAIARALVAEPSVLICDEVTSALDVSVQASIVELLLELKREMGLSMLFVTHNLALVRTVADSVAVLSAGRIVERGGVGDVLDRPQMPYTKTLLANTPTLDAALAAR